MVKLSLAELLLEDSPGDRNVFRKVVRLAEGIENETPVHTALLFYKAKVLHGLGLLDAARDTLTGALRRKKDRSVQDLRLVKQQCGVNSRLGHYFDKYGISATKSLPITDEVTAHVGPDLRGVLLGLVEAWQGQHRWADATACLERLRRLEPDDATT